MSSSKRAVIRPRHGGHEVIDTVNLTIRCPADVSDWLKATAKRERRSVNQQVLVILEAAMQADEADG
jgi:hypothetical protein